MEYHTVEIKDKVASFVSTADTEAVSAEGPPLRTAQPAGATDMDTYANADSGPAPAWRLRLKLECADEQDPKSDM